MHKIYKKKIKEFRVNLTLSLLGSSPLYYPHNCLLCLERPFCSQSVR